MYYKRIFFCEAQVFFPLLLAYNQENYSADEKVAFILPPETFSDALKSSAEKFSVELISSKAVPDDIACEHLILHSFHDYALSSHRLATIPHNVVSTYTDAFKNDFRHFDIWSDAELISWGWEYTKPEYYSFKKAVCISNESIKNVINDLSETFFHDKVPNLKVNVSKNVNILLLRYWGKGVYQFKDGFSIGDACRFYVNEPPGSDIYIKGDDRLLPGQHLEAIESLKSAGYNVFRLEELFEEPDERLEKMPFELIAPFFNSLKIKLYLFDSSVGSYLSTFPNFTPVYPPSGLARAIFNKNECASTVVHWSGVFQNVNDYNAVDAILNDRTSMRSANFRVSSPFDDKSTIISSLANQIQDMENQSFQELSSLNQKVDRILEWQQGVDVHLAAIRARLERRNLVIRILQHVGLWKIAQAVKRAIILKFKP